MAAGDTFESIAKKHYGDPAKAPLVARVNNLDPAGKPAPGTILTLPHLALAAAKPAAKRRAGDADRSPTTDPYGVRHRDRAGARTDEARRRQRPRRTRPR